MPQPKYTQAEHIMMASEGLTALRSEEIYFHDDFKTWENKFLLHSKASGKPIEFFGTSRAEICKRRIQWHQELAKEILYTLRYEASKPEDFYQIEDMTSEIECLRYHLQEGRITLKWLGSSEELISKINRKYHRQQAEGYLRLLRQTRGNLLLFTEYLKHLRSEISAAETTLEQLESSEQEIMDLRFRQA